MVHKKQYLMKQLNNKAFSHFELTAAIIVIATISVTGIYVYNHQHNISKADSNAEASDEFASAIAAIEVENPVSPSSTDTVTLENPEDAQVIDEGNAANAETGVPENTDIIEETSSTPIVETKNVNASSASLRCGRCRSELLYSKLRDLARRSGGKVAISVRDTSGNIMASRAGDTVMPTRSSYKLYTAYATMRAVDSGRISWNTRLRAYGNHSVAYTVKRMIVYSDNSAATALRLNSTIGTPGRVTNMLHGVGLRHTNIGSGTASNLGSTSSANDFTAFLNGLYNRRLPGVKSSNSYARLIAYMSHATTDGCCSRSGIAAGVAPARVADKPGWAPSGPPATNDVAIVYQPGHNYYLAILTNKPVDWRTVRVMSKEINNIVKQ